MRSWRKDYEIVGAAGFVGALLLAVWVGILVGGCVTRTQVCLTADTAKTRDWERQHSVGASVCADIERQQ